MLKSGADMRGRLGYNLQYSAVQQPENLQAACWRPVRLRQLAPAIEHRRGHGAVPAGEFQQNIAQPARFVQK